MTYDIFYIICGCIVLLTILAYAIDRIVKHIKGQDTETREKILQFTACLIEQGVKIPDDLLIKILRGNISLDELSKKFTKLAK